MNEKVKNEIDKACWYEQRQTLGNHNMKLKPYPEYRDSGIEWIGEIPEGWEVRKLKHICIKYAEYGLNISSDNYQTEGIRFIRTSDIDDYGNLQNGGVYLNKSLCKGYTLNCGDLLISRSGTIGRTFLFNSEKNGEATYAGYLVRFSINTNKAMPKYFFYFTKTNSFYGWLEIQSIETTIENVNGQKYANLLLTIPPLPDQIAIANFLDKKTIEIDKLIEKDKKLIELLKEKRTTLINHAVTKGLDPNAKMKESGIEWIGEIPEGWEVNKIKHLTENFDGKRIPISAEKREEGKIPYYGATGVLDYVKDFIFNKELLLVGEDGAPFFEPFKDVAYIINGKSWVNNHAHVLRVIGNNLIKWLCYYLNIYDYGTVIKGSTRDKLNQDQLSNMFVAKPSTKEQTAIAEYLDKATAKIDKTIQKIEEKINLLEEYKKSLIHHVVTGKVDVRGIEI